MLKVLRETLEEADIKLKLEQYKLLLTLLITLIENDEVFMMMMMKFFFQKFWTKTKDQFFM